MASTPQKGHKGLMYLQVPSNHSLDSLVQTKDRHGTRNMFIHPADCMAPSCGPSLVAQKVESLPAMQETLVQFLGRGDPLEKG